MKRKNNYSSSSSHVNSEGEGKYYKIDDKESNKNKFNKEWSSGNYIKAFTHLILPLQNVYEIILVLIFKYFDLLYFKDDLYFISIIITNTLCIISNLSVNFYKKAIFIDYLFSLITDFTRIITLSVSIYNNNDNFYIFSRISDSMGYFYKLLLIFTSIILLQVNLKKLLSKKEERMLTTITICIILLEIMCYYNNFLLSLIFNLILLFTSVGYVLYNLRSNKLNLIEQLQYNYYVTFTAKIIDLAFITFLYYTIYDLSFFENCSECNYKLLLDN
ncbi:hypothetical protein H311_02176 [Anncaliia algerae PRA109]|nr:hypothetical protein H311_02176 [Anncaliia algerae PRA109]